MGSIKLDNVDIVGQVLNNEYQILRILEMLNIAVNKGEINLSQQEWDNIGEICLKKMQEKYPNSGISKVEKEAADGTN